jgi:hypothetical protein
MNLWAPVAGGLVCDMLFILYQRNCMTQFLDAAGVKDGGAKGPPTKPQIKKVGEWRVNSCECGGEYLLTPGCQIEY